MYEFNESLDCNSEKITFEQCEVVAKKNLKTYISDTGRLLIVNVKLCNVLPNKTIAVGILVFQDGVLKGFKARKVYTGEKSKMIFKNINGGMFTFVLPDENICYTADVEVKIVTHYTDFEKICYNRKVNVCNYNSRFMKYYY